MPDLNTSPVGGYQSIPAAVRGAETEASAETGPGFADVMADALSLFRETGAESDAATLNLLTGGTEELSSVLISAEKAEIALNLTVAIRNKAVDAYKEIMNMQV